MPKPWSRPAVVLAVASGISAQMAWLHMVAVWSLGEICGRSPALHCPWCVTAVGFAALAVMTNVRPVRAGRVCAGRTP